ncbi:hypothetical protein BC938DRAFT_470928 [Jimgerdemannia flammicorona]|uniref:Uncharacterized protein n=1 Tax=Jimgerdemannia flammicorona TaxID=994334 RepID=A0A433Q987_9FUNG|nr:hypothetical protein BC938DRAFT_470928 [Jimgerdemannia flammicorona]
MSSQAVILNPAEPAPTLQTFLKDPVYNRRVQYIKGSGLSWQSLEKIQAHTASAYFILAKKFTAQSETIDAENVLRAMALSKYGCSDKLYLQCILPENKIHFENLRKIQEATRVENMAYNPTGFAAFSLPFDVLNQLCPLDPRQIICIDELKLGIFAHSCLTPGFATLIYTLTTSFTNESAEELRFLRNLDNQNKMHIGVDSAIIVDYVRGCAQSIHTTKLSTFFRGLKFWEISELCFTHVGVVLFGLGIRRDERDPLTIDLRRRRRRGSFSGSDRWQTHATNDDDYRNYNVLLNPDDYVVQGGEVAFVVASDEAEAARVASYGLQMERQAVAFDEFENERTSLLKRGKAKAQTDSFAVSQSQGISGQNATFEYLPGLATKPLPVPCRPIPSFTIEDDGQTQRRDHIQTGHRARAMSVPLTSVIGTDSIKTSHQKHSHQFNSRVTSFPGGLPMSPVLLPHNIGSEEATSSLIEHLQDHIVLCDYSGSFPRNLDCFIRPLRKCHLDRFLPVVILCPSRPNQGQWKMLAEFDQVYLIQANPMTREGLNSARIAQARYAVVLTDSTRILKDGEKTEDAPATLVYLNIRALNPSAHIFVEYIHTENTKLMKAFALGRDLQAFNTPAFMSGSVFTVSMLVFDEDDVNSKLWFGSSFTLFLLVILNSQDSIICQSYYQPHLVTILQHLLFGAPPHHLASGKTCPAPSHSHVFQAHVPAAFVGLGYAMLFRYMVRQRRAVPLGLYRTTKLNDNEWYTEAESEELMYVFTCPPGDTILRENDEVFILCRRDPSVERDGVTEL